MVVRVVSVKRKTETTSVSPTRWLVWCISGPTERDPEEKNAEMNTVSDRSQVGGVN